jgi:hypothetical protein
MPESKHTTYLTIANVINKGFDDGVRVGEAKGVDGGQQSGIARKKCRGVGCRSYHFVNAASLPQGSDRGSPHKNVTMK